MTEPLRRALAIGKTFEAFLREGIASGPVYHPEMGEDFLDQPPGAARRAAQRACPPHRRRPLGAGAREPQAPTAAGCCSPPTSPRSGAATRSCGCSALAVEQAADPVEITGPDHGFTFVNHAFETTTGYSPGRGDRPPAAGRPVERRAPAGVLRGDAPRAGGRPGLARHHRQPPPRRPPDRAGDHHRAAARRDRRHHALCRGQARRHRGPRPGARAGRERGALPGGGRRADRVHRARQPGRRLDLHERAPPSATSA